MADQPALAVSLVYAHLDPSVRYTLRLHVITNTAAGQVRPRIDGQPVQPANTAKAIGERQDFAVPAEASKDGTVTVTFDPIDESQVNWRQYSRLVEAWLVAEPDARTSRETGNSR